MTKAKQRLPDPRTFRVIECAEMGRTTNGNRFDVQVDYLERVIWIAQHVPHWKRPRVVEIACADAAKRMGQDLKRQHLKQRKGNADVRASKAAAAREPANSFKHDVANGYVYRFEESPAPLFFAGREVEGLIDHEQQVIQLHPFVDTPARRGQLVLWADFRARWERGEMLVYPNREILLQTAIVLPTKTKAAV